MIHHISMLRSPNWQVKKLRYSSTHHIFAAVELKVLDHLHSNRKLVELLLYLCEEQISRARNGALLSPLYFRVELHLSPFLAQCRIVK